MRGGEQEGPPLGLRGVPLGPRGPRHGPSELEASPNPPTSGAPRKNLCLPISLCLLPFSPFLSLSVSPSLCISVSVCLSLFSSVSCLLCVSQALSPGLSPHCGVCRCLSVSHSPVSSTVNNILYLCLSLSPSHPSPALLLSGSERGVPPPTLPQSSPSPLRKFCRNWSGVPGSFNCPAILE